MNRITSEPRKDYIKKLEDISFEFHSLNNVYWDESAHYEFSLREILKMETATNELFKICLEAVQHVIDNKLYDKLHIDPNLIPLIERSWENEEPSFYGRFDLAFNGSGEPKMLEFNADTPTSLYEGAVVQWYWLKDVAPDNDQFNSIHEKLIDYWKSCIEYFNGETVYFTCVRDSIEDFTTVEYIRDTAHQAGINTQFLYIDEIGWDSEAKIFVDMDDVEIKNIFKLYPWEWLMGEDFGINIMKDVNQSKWIEPAWKAILSNKGILPILWELHPNHPNLLECYFDTPNNMIDYVKKPIYSREGANITIVKNSEETEKSSGEYGDEGYIYQKYVELPNFDGNHPVIGSWVIGGESAGIGIRESKTLITDNLSRYIPHLITQY